MIGEVISHYRVLDRLGEGGMGEVFLVEDLKLHRRVALKLIAEHLTRDQERRQRFVQEATLAASIDHPHIAAIYDIDESNGRTFIAMEYVRGHSLRDLLRSGPLRPRRAIDLAIQIGDALAKVHEHGVVHRDLKPENVLVATDGYAKIIDFGVAKLADPLKQSGLADAATVGDAGVRTAEGVVVGTMAYMSPEQARGEQVDARSDIFSFGAVLQEMFTGTPPFRRGSAAETLSAILAEPPTPVRVDAGGAEPELQRIIRKCLVKDATDRIQSMRDVVVDLRDAREAMGSGTTTARARAEAASRVRDRRVVMAVAALGVLAVLGAAALGLRWRVGPSDTAGGPPSARPAIAVLAFDVLGAGADAAWLAKGLPSMLVTGLAQTPDLEVVGLERLSDAAKQMGASSLDAVERPMLSEVARRAGARFVVAGSLVQAGDELRIDARVEDLGSGSVRLATSVRGRDALALADDLAARIRSGFDLKPSGDVHKIADVASASVDAYRAYTTGVEAFNNMRTDDARRLFEEAVRLDPGFALAHVWLALVADASGDPTHQRQHLANAAQHLNRVTEREALFIRGNLAKFDGRVEEAEELFESVIGRYPDTENAYVTLADIYMPFSEIPDPQKAVSILERGARALPYSAGTRNVLGYAQLANGQFDEAIRTFELYTKLRPTEPNAIDSLAEGYLASGDAVTAVDTYSRALAAGHAPSRTGRAWSYAVLGRYDDALSDLPAPSFPRWLVLSRVGRYREAAAEIASDRSLTATQANAERLAMLSLVEATFAFELSDCAKAARAAAGARREVSGLPAVKQRQWLVFADLVSGTCEARMKHLEPARATLERARARHRALADHERWWVRALEGELALASGDSVAAARSFSAGEPAGRMILNLYRVGVLTSFLANNLILRDGRARAAMAAGRLDEAIAIYLALLTPGRQNKWTSMLEPRYVLALASLLEKAGQGDAARAEYERFLDLWKAADRDLPELADARRGVERVR